MMQQKVRKKKDPFCCTFYTEPKITALNKVWSLKILAMLTSLHAVQYK